MQSNGASMEDLNSPSFVRREKSIKTNFRTQASALFRKNLAQQKRSLAANIFIILTPIFFCAVLYALQIVVNNAFDTPDNKCGCLCTTCCLEDAAGVKTCRDGTPDNPCQTFEKCETYDTNTCGFEYSDPEQAQWCALPSPSIWPALMQVPSIGYMVHPYSPAAAFLYTGDDEAAASGITGTMFSDPNITEEDQAQSAEFLLKGTEVGAFYAASVSMLGITLGTFQKFPFWTYYIEPGFVRLSDYNGTLYLLVNNTDSPIVQEVVANLTTSFSQIVGAAGVRVAPTIEAIQALPVWVDSADDINRQLYCGYEDSRCDGAARQYNEYPLAWDFKNTSASGNFQVRMWYNASATYGDEASQGAPPYILRVNQGLNTAVNGFLKWAMGPGYEAQLIGIMDTPKGASELNLDFSTLLGPLFYTWLLQLLLPMMLVNLVQERAGRLRQMMKMHGLGDAPYWCIQYFWYFTTNLIYAWVLIGAGSAIQLSFFTRTEYSFQFVFYLLWVSCLVAFSFLLSTLFKSARTATVVSFLYVFGTGLIGLILLARFVSAGYWWVIFLELVPGFGLYRGLWEISQYAFRGAYQDDDGITWTRVAEDDNGLIAVMIIFAVESIVFLVLAWYLEQVLPGGTGVPRHPLFFLGRKYGGEEEESRKRAKGKVAALDEVALSMEADDVKAERHRIESFTPSDLQSQAITIKNLRKIFPAIGGGKEKEAVRGLTMAVNTGECFGLLGPNGAGKSTTLNILTGFLTPSSGGATVVGHDITSDMDSVYGIMGVCPQDNLLWDRLTAREHLEFYGRLKNLHGPDLKTAVDEALRSVNLFSGGVADRRVKTFSGGMKRRLSVAVALIGDPLVVYLDEPSTGLDPASRHNLWNVVQEAKQGRGIILTTHSMEEASVLCDRLGIFVDGQLVCIGNPKELTARYGRYLVFTINTPPEQALAVDALVQRMSPNAHLVYSLAGTRKYEIPTSDVTLAQVFETMESAAGGAGGLTVLDWGVANATLEEVFIRFAKSIAAEGGN